MKVAIVGAGAVARVYAVRLALRAGVDVTLVTRPGRALAGPLRIERVDGSGDVESWSEPRFATSAPADVDVILVAVRADQLDASLDPSLGEGRAPLVVLTPMMPSAFASLSSRVGARLRPAMIGVVAYVNPAGACRYWLPMGTATLLDDTPPTLSVTSSLEGALSRAGFVTRREVRVQESNLATTVAIAPAAMAIDAAGSIDALLADRRLLASTVAAVKEALALARSIGRTAAWLDLVTPFIGSTSIRVGALLGRSRAPEAFAYVEEHFGRKLHAQNVAMGREVLALARRSGAPCASIEGLLRSLA